MITVGIQIREAALAERTQIAAITRESYSEFEKTADPQFWREYELSTERTLLYDESILRLVALCDEEIAGTVLLCPPYETRYGGKVVKNAYPEMRLLAVPPKHRNYGVAAKLIDECESRTRNSGYDAITLHTTRLMETAKAMYERRGYSRYAEIDFEPVPGFVVWGFIKHF